MVSKVFSDLWFYGAPRRSRCPWPPLVSPPGPQGCVCPPPNSTPGPDGSPPPPPPPPHNPRAGNVVNGTIARQMVDMLVESSSNVTMILKFFDMFLKLRDIVASDAFRDYVSDPRGLISKKDFQKAMDSQKQYEPAEIQFLLSCSEADENEMIDVEAFAGRFQE
ncbi:PREDICTED: ryanodine receptor 1-like, partial [Leptosomus discolor]|uniref:ryanodine receptor 1-like n=1 Tax=Leptosomus discolor TaxID=188344 RepID=UPI000522CC71